MSELTTLFTNIANAIRAKGETSGTIQASQFPTAIANIPSGATVTRAKPFSDNYLIKRAYRDITNLLFLCEDLPAAPNKFIGGLILNGVVVYALWRKTETEWHYEQPLVLATERIPVVVNTDGEHSVGKPYDLTINFAGAKQYTIIEW